MSLGLHDKPDSNQGVAKKALFKGKGIILRKRNCKLSGPHLNGNLVINKVQI